MVMINFYQKQKKYGISGVIIPDLPYEERGELLEIAKKYDIEVISFIAPTSEKRIQSIATDAKGFIYLVSSLGVTGTRNEIKTDINSIISNIKKVTKTPVAIGFGINTIEQAEKYSKIADGIIVGSAIVKIIAKYEKDAPEEVYKYVKSMKNAIL